MEALAQAGATTVGVLEGCADLTPVFSRYTPKTTLKIRVRTVFLFPMCLWDHGVLL